MRGGKLKINNLSGKEKGYFFGMFEGDGYKFHDKKSRHYHVEFYLNSEKDKDVLVYVVELIKKAGLKPMIYLDKRCNCKRIRVYSKEFFEILHKNVKTHNKDNNFMIGFVSGLIDSEGSVNKKKSYIMVVNTNKDILEKCRRFLDSININSNISLRKPSIKEKLKSYRMYISVSFKNKPHLSVKTKRLQ